MRQLYPPPKEWKAIRERTLMRAANACECHGECGIEHFGRRCGAAHQARILRRRVGETVAWHEHEGCSLCLGGDDECRPILVVLTIAHLDHDPTNNVGANLRAFCQLCHLRYDRHEHAKNAANTRATKRDQASGQTRLFARERLGAK